MSNIINMVRMDESDAKYVKLRDTFKEEIKRRFVCDDYEPIVNYVFNYVFESKNTREDSMNEMKELFLEKSEEIINLLWSLTERVYSTNEQDDLLDEIYKDRTDGGRDKKSFQSQIVNPNADNKYNKPLFNTAVERVRGEKFQNHRDYYPPQRGRYGGRGGYGGHGEYDNRRYRQEDNKYDHRPREGVKTMNVGGKQIIIKKKNIRSRSRSNERKSSRDQEENRAQTGEHHVQEIYEEREQGYDQRYEKDHYQGDRYMTERGYYNPRGRFQRGGRFSRYMNPRFQELRRPMIRNRFPPQMGRIPGQQPYIQIKKGTEENLTNIKYQPTSETQNISTPITNKDDQTTTVNAGHPQQEYVQVNEEGKAEDSMNKKKIRCRKWPSCKTENCDYAHPSETCPFFPKCHFASKCLYIHPNIPCKYGFYCTRLGCAYSHAPGYAPGMYPNMVPGMSMSYGPPKFKNMKMDNTRKNESFNNSINTYINNVAQHNNVVVKTTTEPIDPLHVTEEVVKQETQQEQ